MVHGGIHFNAAIPWLALIAMLIVVASGLTGRVLLSSARAGMEAKAAELRAQGLTPEAIEEQLEPQTLVVDVMKRWRMVHLPLTAAFLGLVALHVGATLALWSWR